MASTSHLPPLQARSTDTVIQSAWGTATPAAESTVTVHTDTLAWSLAADSTRHANGRTIHHTRPVLSASDVRATPISLTVSACNRPAACGVAMARTSAAM